MTFFIPQNGGGARVASKFSIRNQLRFQICSKFSTCTETLGLTKFVICSFAKKSPNPGLEEKADIE